MYLCGQLNYIGIYSVLHYTEITYWVKLRYIPYNYSETRAFCFQYFFNHIKKLLKSLFILLRNDSLLTSLILLHICSNSAEESMRPVQ